MRSRFFSLSLCALALTTPAAPLPGQTIASQVDRIRDGSVRMSFATRGNVCGNGEFIGVDRADGFWMYSAGGDNFSTNVLKDVKPNCRAGPLRLVVVKAGGRVTELRAAVGVTWRESLAATDLGTVSAPAAAAWLVGLVETGNDQVGRIALLAASVADSARVTDPVIRLAQNRRLSAEARDRALRWLEPIAAAEGRSDDADRTLEAMAGDETEVVAIRERAIRSLGTSAANRAYLRSLYAQLGQVALKERILRELGSAATDEEAAWIRTIVLDPREATALRDRGIRVLGELGRTSEVRDLYGKLDQVTLKDRALRVVAERHEPDAEQWLRQVAEDGGEAVDLRDRAIRLLAERNEITYLQLLYPRLDRVELRDRVLRSAAETNTPEAAAWLTRIVLDSTEPGDLRDRAVRELAERGAPSEDLAALYDRVDASAVKRRLVRLLAERHDDAAVRKLKAIAGTDPDPAMRREASRRLIDETT